MNTPESRPSASQAKEQLLRAILAIIVREDFHGATAAEIAAELGVSRQTVYARLRELKRGGYILTRGKPH
jgi:AcrR family transcriptional regulator